VCLSLASVVGLFAKSEDREGGEVYSFSSPSSPPTGFDAWGLQVEVATDLTAARRAISHHPPNVILLNLSFPRTAENGLTLLAQLHQRTPTIPVLVLSGRNQLSDRVEVARLGGHAFLQKPIAPEQILKAVTQELDLTQEAEAKVLIVDDDAQVLAALSALLEPWGLHVTTFADSLQFWQVLEATAPDLLILDVEMPDFSGIELCQVVRNAPRWSELPISSITLAFMIFHRETLILR
jgi:CheY-like chemotaxis protein